MAREIGEIFAHALTISVFVFVMMIIVDYLNVLAPNKFPKRAKGFFSYVSASFLGVFPGCLGTFAAVSLYERGVISFGALASAMIATSGDEAFVMLSVFPQKAIMLFALLFVLAVISGSIIDFLAKRFGFKGASCCEHSDISSHGDECRCLNMKEILLSLSQMPFSKFLILFIIAGALYMEMVGVIGSEHETWMKITFSVLMLISFLICLSMPDHYLEKHIYEHIMKKHLWRVFLWTFGALIFVHFFINAPNTSSLLKSNIPVVIFLAALLGIVPESGPNLVFVMLYAQGSVPFSVLLANSIVQDGHGMLPMLAFSLRDSIYLKILNLIIGLCMGYLLYFLGL